MGRRGPKPLFDGARLMKLHRLRGLDCPCSLSWADKPTGFEPMTLAELAQTFEVARSTASRYLDLGLCPDRPKDLMMSSQLFNDLTSCRKAQADVVHKWTGAKDTTLEAILARVERLAAASPENPPVRRVKTYRNAEGEETVEVFEEYDELAITRQLADVYATLEKYSPEKGLPLEPDRPLQHQQVQVNVVNQAVAVDSDRREQIRERVRQLPPGVREQLRQVIQGDDEEGKQDG